MALEYSKFGDALKAIIEGIDAAIETAWNDVPGERRFVDRNQTECTTLPYSVVVPHDVQMDLSVVSVREILQIFSFTIYLIDEIEPDSNLVYQKINRADAVIELLMASNHFLSMYELPIVTRVSIAEADPDPAVSVLEIDFTVQAANYKHSQVP